MKEFGEDENIEDILWRYKHLIENARSFYQISLEQFERFNADFKRRCVEQGFSLRAYYDKSFYFYFY